MEKPRSAILAAAIVEHYVSSKKLETLTRQCVQKLVRSFNRFIKDWGNNQAFDVPADEETEIRRFCYEDFGIRVNRHWGYVDILDKKLFSALAQEEDDPILASFHDFYKVNPQPFDSREVVDWVVYHKLNYVLDEMQ